MNSLPETTARGRRHILFVDDEAPTRELISLHLRRTGYDVTTAMSAGEGRALLADRGFDLAVFDVDLAGENGMDLLVYSKSRIPGLPVILFTGLNVDEQLVGEARKRGAEGCMSKTQPLAELVAEVRRLAP